VLSFDGCTTSCCKCRYRHCVAGASCYVTKHLYNGTKRCKQSIPPSSQELPAKLRSSCNRKKHADTPTTLPCSSLTLYSLSHPPNHTITASLAA
jgi:hypothetical protein